jgi:hypothetical protein
MARTGHTRLLQMYQFLSNTLLFTLDGPIHAGRVENRR